MLRSAPGSVPLRIRGAQVLFDVRTLSEVAKEIVESDPDGWRTVVTPNLHHIHLLRQDAELIDLYKATDLLLPDGWPVAWMLSRVSRSEVGRVAGSDLLEHALASKGGGRPLVLVGGEDADALTAVAERAVQSQWNVFLEPAPHSEVEGLDSRRALARRVARKGTGGVVVLGLGAPKQERFAHEIKSLDGSGHILCLGMAINFSAGRYKRSPEWMQRANIEWIHRILSEPRRLLPRYARDAGALLPTLAENSRVSA